MELVNTANTKLIGMSHSLIASLSRDISSGRAFWALLRLNEFTNLPTSVRGALRSKIAVTLAGQNLGAASKLVTRALAGARLTDFSAVEQACIKSVTNAQSTVSTNKKKFSLEAHLTSHLARRSEQRTEAYGEFSRYSQSRSGARTAASSYKLAR